VFGRASRSRAPTIESSGIFLRSSSHAYPNVPERAKPHLFHFHRHTDLSVQPQPAWNRQPRVADKKFWAVGGAAVGSSLLVVPATSHCRQAVGIGNCLGGYGSFKAMQGLQIGLSGFLATLGYWWKKSEQETHDKHPQWWVVPVSMTAYNTFRVVQQYSKSCPGNTKFNGDRCQ
jgi:hypothetical protein